VPVDWDALHLVSALLHSLGACVIGRASGWVVLDSPVTHVDSGSEVDEVVRVSEGLDEVLVPSGASA
jgi:hypothetical protein